MWQSATHEHRNRSIHILKSTHNMHLTDTSKNWFLLTRHILQWTATTISHKILWGMALSLNSSTKEKFFFLLSMEQKLGCLKMVKVFVYWAICLPELTSCSVLCTNNLAYREIIWVFKIERETWKNKYVLEDDHKQ